MPIPDLTPLVDAGGWVFASAVLSAIIWLITTGRLIPSRPYEREAERSDAQDERLDKLTETVNESTSLLRTLVTTLERSKGGPSD